MSLLPANSPVLAAQRAQEEEERASIYARAALASGTLRVYLSAWRDFEVWCTQRQQSALPATSECVARYLGDLADRGTP